LPETGYQGLSCYTANLARYLDVEWDGAALVAGSVFLAVRTDLADGLLAFSHHDRDLSVLPDGSRLSYACAAAVREAVEGVAAELAVRGRVLVVTDGSRLPWSPAFRCATAPVPHWVLIDGREGDRWRVVDEFSGLLPMGEQRPYQGWLPARVLEEAMTLPSAWTAEQDLRNRLAFGRCVPVPPAGQSCWLRRVEHSQAAAAPGPPAGTWLAGDERVLPFLAGYFARGSAHAFLHLDDIWAAAGHRAFACRWYLRDPRLRPELKDRLRAELGCWERLPQIVRIVAESALRGRPRASLAQLAVAELLQAQRPADLAG
jgi:hypothetical protein